MVLLDNHSLHPSCLLNLWAGGEQAQNLGVRKESSLMWWSVTSRTSLVPPPQCERKSLTLRGAKPLMSGSATSQLCCFRQVSNPWVSFLTHYGVQKHPHGMLSTRAYNTCDEFCIGFHTCGKMTKNSGFCLMIRHWWWSLPPSSSLSSLMLKQRFKQLVTDIQVGVSTETPMKS